VQPIKQVFRLRPLIALKMTNMIGVASMATEPDSLWLRCDKCWRVALLG